MYRSIQLDQVTGVSLLRDAVPLVVIHADDIPDGVFCFEEDDYAAEFAVQIVTYINKKFKKEIAVDVERKISYVRVSYPFPPPCTKTNLNVSSSLRLLNECHPGPVCFLCFQKIGLDCGRNTPCTSSIENLHGVLHPL